VQDSTGAKHVIVVDENPVLGLIYNVSSEAFFTASISPNTQSPTYAGYEIANSSSASVAVTYAEADWTVPSVSLPTGSSGDPSCTETQTGQIIYQCIVADWVGIQNSTYNGNYFPTGTGEVLQTGTLSNYTCYNSVCTSREQPWMEYLRASVEYSGPADNKVDLTYCNFGGHSGSIGDSMTGEAGTDSQVEGSGSNYATILVDWTCGTGSACSNSDYPAGTEVHTEYYADYMAERITTGAGFPVALPDFSTTYFSNLEMGTGTSQQLNPYYNYNNGWGSGMYMYNDGTRLTTTSSMSSVGGDVNEAWDSSIDT